MEPVGIDAFTITNWWSIVAIATTKTIILPQLRASFIITDLTDSVFCGSAGFDLFGALGLFSMFTSIFRNL